MYDGIKIAEEFRATMVRAREECDGAGLVGHGVIALLDKRGHITDLDTFINKITTAGDEYLARKAITAIAPANAAAPTAMTGMKLGTGVTAASKSGAGAALGTYITGSNNLFDATYPQVAAVGGDTGWNATYRVTWAAGDVTNSAITEAAIVNDAATDATTTAANTMARVTFTAKNKTADDSLVITWSTTFFG